MTLVLKQILPNDYGITRDGEIVGRIYRIRGTEVWRWTARLQDPVGGVADSLDEAKAAFRRAWEHE